MKFEFARLRDERHPIAAPLRRHGRGIFKDALQPHPSDLVELLWFGETVGWVIAWD